MNPYSFLIIFLLSYFQLILSHTYKVIMVFKSGKILIKENKNKINYD